VTTSAPPTLTAQSLGGIGSVALVHRGAVTTTISKCYTQHRCGGADSCTKPQRIYRGTLSDLNYPVTVNLCDDHAEEAKADGWTLDPK
jgi:hypothetical protein